MKKKISLILSIVMLLASSTTIANAVCWDLQVFVDGINVYENSENKPFIHNNRTLVPLRPIFESLGIDEENIKWYPEESKATFSDGNAMCTFVNGSNTAILEKTDGTEQTVKLDVPAMIYNGNFHIPIRAYCKLWDMSIEWHGEERSVYINSEESYGEQTVIGYNAEQWLGTWYHTNLSAPQTASDWSTIEIKNENGKYYAVWGDGTTEEIVFISDTVAQGTKTNTVTESGSIDMNRNTVDVGTHTKRLFEFGTLNGAQYIEPSVMCAETNTKLMAEWQKGFREIPEEYKDVVSEENPSKAMIGGYVWSDDASEAALVVSAVNGNDVTFSMTFSVNAGRMAALEATVTLDENGYGTFSNAEDNWGNKNTGYVKFEGNSVKFKVTEDVVSPTAEYGFSDYEFELIYD